VSDSATPRHSTTYCQWREYAGFPDLARLCALRPDRYPHLLESVAHGTVTARFDILFAFPEQLLQLSGTGDLTAEPALNTGDFLDALDGAWRAEHIAEPDAIPFPFQGGWFLYLGYELAGTLEPGLGTIPGDAEWPMAFAQRFPAAIMRDHVLQQTLLMCETGRDRLLDEMEQDLRLAETTMIDMTLPPVRAVREEDPHVHLDRIRHALEYIRRGDTYQVNLSRRWEADYSREPNRAALYARLRNTNPAPFSGLCALDNQRAVISSSPERLVHARHGKVHTRPIAGTHPRFADAVLDRQQRSALHAHPKERAEHVMLVDLERNDLGKICRPGTICADELLAVESYPHVHHLVSNVSGVLNIQVTPGNIIRALFPGGTITGCPKVRTMQIIAELEDEPRRAYTGSMGYLNRDGSLDLNILIRTLCLDRQQVTLRAGGGIVADSIPEREIEETRAKARGMLDALSMVDAPC